MSCERIEELLAEQRDALSEELARSPALREHSESCAACRALVAEHRDVRRALLPLESVHPRWLPAKRGGSSLAIAAASIFVLALGIVLLSADRIPAHVRNLPPRWLPPSLPEGPERSTVPGWSEPLRRSSGPGDSTSKPGGAFWRPCPRSPTRARILS